MRSGGLFVAVLCLAACGSIEGAWIEVQGTDSTARFDVFIASEDAECEKCDLRPKDVDAMLAGSRFLRDPEPVRAVTASSSHAGEFSFHAGGSAKVHAVVIVGYDAENAITGAALIDHLKIEEPHRYRVTLTPVTGENLGTRPPTLGPQRAQVWGSEEAHGKCAGLEQWHDGELLNRTFIVPANDPDCDGVLEDLECNPYAYLSSASADPGVINCVTAASPATPCMLGATSCVDGETTGVCAPGRVCVPRSLCTDLTPCTSGDERACLLERLRATPSARVVCHIPFELDPNASPALRTCDGLPASASIEGLGVLFTNGNVSCQSVSVTSSGSGSVLPFAPMASYNGGELAVQLKVAGPCNVEVSWSGGFDPVTSATPILGLKIGTNGAHDLLLPLRIIQDDCDGSMRVASCALELDADPIASCAK